MLKPSTNDPNYKKMMEEYKKDNSGWGRFGLPRIKKTFEPGQTSVEDKPKEKWFKK